MLIKMRFAPDVNNDDTLITATPIVPEVPVTFATTPRALYVIIARLYFLWSSISI